MVHDYLSKSQLIILKLKLRERSIAESNTVADARASLDEGYEHEEGQHGELPEASMGLGQYIHDLREGKRMIYNAWLRSFVIRRLL